MPLLMSHHLFFCLAQEANTAYLLNEEGMAEITRKSLARARAELQCGQLIGSELWCGGTPCNFDHVQTLELLTLTLPGLAGDSNL